MELKPNECFKMTIIDEAEPIYARECFDKSTAKLSDTPYFCPFNLKDDAFAWANETIQAMKKTE